jgi:uncharacterized membrane protein YciS (DUF1049 family)
MVRLLKLLIFVPIAILVLAFAFANRQSDVVSFDPFGSLANSAFSVEAPLFVLLILSMMLGVLLGGVAVWFGQGKHRRAARAHRATAEKLRAELDAAKAKLPAPSNSYFRRA